MSRDIYMLYADEIGHEPLTDREKYLALSNKRIEEIRLDWIDKPWVSKAITTNLSNALFWLEQTSKPLTPKQAKLARAIMEFAMSKLENEIVDAILSRDQDKARALISIMSDEQLSEFHIAISRLLAIINKEVGKR
jgi:predicted MarR family transcription regulator